MFRNEYIGQIPYISCIPSLHHHRLCPKDHFLVLCSDGLYQYLSNEEVVSHVKDFMEKCPDGDPAQHLIEELLFRAAKKAGMDFYELLDIPQRDRRKYHNDVTVMVVSLEGRIWKSSGKIFKSCYLGPETIGTMLQARPRVKRVLADLCSAHHVSHNHMLRRNTGSLVLVSSLRLC
ncbi:unnamed protein product [Cuscuta epithymum]|uniref:PPM-type phosphatase domain-containing protein n=1 Tax=Cuscuta epithymum TaxID=186058 RepID=A0AAV0CKK7_9ASTE|nr:unnamed protein product [Cuscuta epithymum]